MTDAEPARARPAAPPILLGTLVFLASETMFFAGLFAAYFTLRSQAVRWPTFEIQVAQPAVATSLLVASSFTLARGVRLLRAGGVSGFRGWVAATLLLGTVFLGLQLHDYSRLEFTVASDSYGTLFYSMTGFHGLHVLAGLLLMLVVLGRAAQGAYASGDPTGAEAVAYYWHFVDAVWIALFATLYVLQ